MDNYNNAESSYGRRPVWQWVLIYLVIAVIVYGLIYFLFIAKKGSYTYSSSSPSYTAASMPTQSSRVVNSASAKQMFKTSDIYKSAYKIFPGQLLAESKQAMIGFSMETKNMSDGSTQVTLNAQNPEYKSQQYIVKSGYTLYFVEKISADDNLPQNLDKNLKDDTAVLVDSDGYIVQ